MLPNLFPLVSSDAGVTALIGSNPCRFYKHGSAPQKVALPYVTHRAISGIPQNNLSGLPLADDCRVQVSCWSKDPDEVETVAAAIRAAIEPTCDILDVRSGGRDPVTMNYRVDLDVQVWVHSVPTSSS